MFTREIKQSSNIDSGVARLALKAMLILAFFVLTFISGQSYSSGEKGLASFPPNITRLGRTPGRAVNAGEKKSCSLLQYCESASVYRSRTGAARLKRSRKGGAKGSGLITGITIGEPHEALVLKMNQRQHFRRDRRIGGPFRNGVAVSSRRGDPSISRLIYTLAPQYGLPPELVLAVVQVESNYNANARSEKNAQGLMQLIPETATRFGVTDVWDPEQNLRGGMAYLRWLLNYFDGDTRLALAGYNAGENAVLRHRGIPPYPETQAYVRRITDELLP
jgi:hypothetical protein